MQVTGLLVTELGQPGVGRLGDQEAGQQAQAKVDPSQDEQEVWDSTQEVLVCEVSFVRTRVGGADVVGVEDGSLDVVEDESSTTKPSHHAAHGDALLVGEPAHARCECRDECDVLTEGRHEPVCSRHHPELL